MTFHAATPVSDNMLVSWKAVGQLDISLESSGIMGPLIIPETGLFAKFVAIN